ncbi:MAG: hypothetical protein GQ531_11785 [Sulfurovum sp.]|nr:hypothetical protein [Sulfurovum sp.]
MLKKVAIVVGSQDSGKSTTINKHLKPKLGIKEKAYLFWKKQGYVMSQSIEESNINLDSLLKKCIDKKFVVLAARPDNERRTELTLFTKILKENGFDVKPFTLKERTDNHQNIQSDEIVAYFEKEI